MSTAPVTFSSKFTELHTGVRTRPHTTLISRARRGDREAFTEMVSPYIPTLLQRARRVTGNVADAEDVRQETLLRAWSRLDQFSGTCEDNTDDFRAWLARIAGNTSIDALRQRRDGKHLSLEEPRGASEESLATLLETKSADPRSSARAAKWDACSPTRSCSFPRTCARLACSATSCITRRRKSPIACRFPSLPSACAYSALVGASAKRWSNRFNPRFARHEPPPIAGWRDLPIPAATAATCSA